jgi:hypothetical protein
VVMVVVVERSTYIERLRKLMVSAPGPRRVPHTRSPGDLHETRADGPAHTFTMSILRPFRATDLFKCNNMYDTASIAFDSGSRLTRQPPAISTSGQRMCVQ